MSVTIEFLEVGHTKHNLKMVSQKSPATKVPFPATVALLHHESIGYLLFDTGYSARFHSITKKFPEKLYALITPVELAEQESLISQLACRGIRPCDIRYIILSHFHADHIGGVSDFPKAQYLYLESAYSSLQGLGRFRAVLFHGFLKGLLPDDFLARSSPFTIHAKNQTHLPFESFPVGLDLFGDGSIMAVDLPGHAPGHLGLLVYADEGTFFLVGDACWVRQNYLENSHPHWIARKFVLDNEVQYDHTVNKIAQMNRQHPEVTIVPCHCSESHRMISDNTSQGVGRA